MSSSSPNLEQVMQEWRNARRLYPLYVALDQQFKLGVGPCPDLVSPINRAEPEVLERVRKWLDQVDQKVTAYHLRVMLQNHPVASEENLRALLQRYLAWPKKTEIEKSKIDFLLVQYFSLCAPIEMQDGETSPQDFADVLEPVLGESSTMVPSALQPLELLAEKLGHCERLSDLLELHVVEQGRALKSQCGEMYYGTSALIAFTRYNFLVRRAFFRLMHDDRVAIRTGLALLQAKGGSVVDCTAAGMRADESIENLRQFANDWKQVFRGEYADGPTFKAIAMLRGIIEDAVAKTDGVDREGFEERVSAASMARGFGPAPNDEPELCEEPDTSTQDATAFSVRAVAERVGSKIRAAAPHMMSINLPVVHVPLGHQELLLSSWEVQAFLNSQNVMNEAIRRAVAARAMMIEAVDSPEAPPDALEIAMAAAEVEAASIQEYVAQAREANDVDSSVNLAATAKRLIDTIELAQQSVGGA